jgi:hypothetical protein
LFALFNLLHRLKPVLVLPLAISLVAIPAITQAQSSAADPKYVTQIKTLGDECLNAKAEGVAATEVDQLCNTKLDEMSAAYAAHSDHSTGDNEVSFLYASAVLHVLVANELQLSNNAVTPLLCAYSEKFSSVSSQVTNWQGFAPADSILSAKGVVEEHVLPLCSDNQ